MQKIIKEANYTWRVVILDITEMYTKIYDEVYGENSETLHKLLDLYSKKPEFLCIILES